MTRELTQKSRLIYAIKSFALVCRIFQENINAVWYQIGNESYDVGQEGIRFLDQNMNFWGHYRKMLRPPTRDEVINEDEVEYIQFSVNMVIKTKEHHVIVRLIRYPNFDVYFDDLLGNPAQVRPLYPSFKGYSLFLVDGETMKDIASWEKFSGEIRHDDSDSEFAIREYFTKTTGISETNLVV